jgi:hypothetical protein
MPVKTHPYRYCRDPECPRVACQAYRQGYDDGHEDGVAAGYDAGFAAGQAAGCNCS